MLKGDIAGATKGYRDLARRHPASFDPPTHTTVTYVCAAPARHQVTRRDEPANPNSDPNSHHMFVRGRRLKQARHRARQERLTTAVRGHVCY